VAATRKCSNCRLRVIDEKPRIDQVLLDQVLLQEGRFD
jgi:hypothetical protein